jgi:ABC-type lipoprotein release transport system permease subunit
VKEKEVKMGMYFKLMFRGMLRHRKSGKGLFVLLAVCSLAILFSLAFMDSFAQRFRQFCVDVMTADLQIVSVDSPKNKATAFSDNKQGLALINLDESMRNYLARNPAIEGWMPTIETGAGVFSLGGDSTGEGGLIVGVDPAVFQRVLPAANLNNSPELVRWQAGKNEVQVLRSLPDPMRETIVDNSRFNRGDFRFSGEEWEKWKLEMVTTRPKLLGGVGGAAIQGEPGDAVFLDALSKLLEKNDLLELLPPPTTGAYNWRLDDATVQLETLQETPAQTSSKIAKLKLARKIYIQSVFSDAIRPIHEGVILDTSYTMAIPPAKGDDLLGKPVIMPIITKSYGQKMTFYPVTFYMDNAALQKYLNIPGTSYTSVVIRLKPGVNLTETKREVSQWLAVNKPGYVVMDTDELGKIVLSAIMSFNVTSLILVVLMVATVLVFVVNSITLALIKRRREIGTTIALGFSAGQNALVIFGEMFFMVLLAWVVGGFAGTLLELLMAQIGLPGIVFLPGRVLKFIYNPWHALATLTILLPAALAATGFSLRRISGVRVVELLKEVA